MKRGTKTKPTALKLVTGNPGKRALPENEPVSNGPAVMPAFMLEPERIRAAAVWDLEAPWLELNGFLTAQTAGEFAVYCTLRAQFERDPEAMPTSRIAEMRKYAEKFHLAPNGFRPEPAADPAAEFFGT